jgi:hypothetical protein
MALLAVDRSVEGLDVLRVAVLADLGARGLRERQCAYEREEGGEQSRDARSYRHSVLPGQPNTVLRRMMPTALRLGLRNRAPSLI